MAKYSPDERKAMVDLARDVGAKEASVRLGVPEASLRTMMWRAGQVTKARAAMVPVEDVHLPALADFEVEPWEELRERMPDELGRLGRLAMAAATAAVQTGNGTEADKMASVAVKCITNAEALRGRGGTQQVPVSVVLTASLEALQKLQVIDASAVDRTVTRALLHDTPLVEQAVDGEDDL